MPQWEQTLRVIRAGYEERCAILLEQLAEHLPEHVSWTRPVGGFFTWLTLPRLPAATDMIARAIAHRLVLVPGDACYVQPPPMCHVRLAYSNGTRESLVEGAQRLAAAIVDG